MLNIESEFGKKNTKCKVKSENIEIGKQTPAVLLETEKCVLLGPHYFPPNDEYEPNENHSIEYYIQVYISRRKCGDDCKDQSKDD